MRKIEFIAENAEVLRQLFLSEKWEELESNLMWLVEDYGRKVVDYRQGFQV